MSEHAAENDAPRVENGWCLDCPSHTCEHAHAVDPDPECRCPGCCPIPPGSGVDR